MTATKSIYVLIFFAFTLQNWLMSFMCSGVRVQEILFVHSYQLIWNSQSTDRSGHRHSPAFGIGFLYFPFWLGIILLFLVNIIGKIYEIETKDRMEHNCSGATTKYIDSMCTIFMP